MGDPRLTRWDRTRRLWYRHEDRVFRAFAIVGAIVLIALMATGCASMDPREHEEMHCAGFTHQDEAPNGQPFRYEWTKTRPASEKPWHYIYAADVDFACRITGADPHHKLQHINGCAVWRPAGCEIYLQEGTQ